MTVWRTVQITLKDSGAEKTEGQTKILKREKGEVGSRGGCLKKGEGAGTPLRTMIY